MLLHILWQAKAYARANGMPLEKQNTDRSRVGIDRSWYDVQCEDHMTGSTSPLINPSYTFILFLCIFILSNFIQSSQNFSLAPKARKAS